MQKTYRFLSDPGHGWIEVPAKDVCALGIQGKISRYSYLGGRASNVMLFLEEDCDGSYFMFHAKKAGWQVTLVDTYVNHFDHSRLLPYGAGTEYDYEAQSKEMYGP